jgi:hypothetical protein
MPGGSTPGWTRGSPPRGSDGRVPTAADVRLWRSRQDPGAHRGDPARRHRLTTCGSASRRRSPGRCGTAGSRSRSCRCRPRSCRCRPTGRRSWRCRSSRRGCCGTAWELLPRRRRHRRPGGPLRQGGRHAALPADRGCLAARHPGRPARRPGGLGAVRDRRAGGAGPDREGRRRPGRAEVSRIPEGATLSAMLAAGEQHRWAAQSLYDALMGEDYRSCGLAADTAAARPRGAASSAASPCRRPGRRGC